MYSAFPRELQRLLSFFAYGRSLWAELNVGENSLHWKAHMLPLFSIMTLWCRTRRGRGQPRSAVSGRDQVRGNSG